VPWLLIHTDTPDDLSPLELAELVTLDKVDVVCVMDGGYLAGDRDELDPRKAATRARQARYRARKRVARDGADDVARDATVSTLDHSRRATADDRPLEGGGRSSDGPDATPRDASRRDAPDDATRRDTLPGAEDWRVEPLTDADRETGRYYSSTLAERLRGHRER
jgi:hypothetical protein